MFFMCVFVYSCAQKNPVDVESPLLDSLNDQCYALVEKLQVDSLRMISEEYMKESPKGSRHFFRARQYYINSYFNARDYDKVLSLLDDTQQIPHFNDHPTIACDYIYTRARAFQYSARYPEAINAFKQCLAFYPKEESQQ